MSRRVRKGKTSFGGGWLVQVRLAINAPLVKGGNSWINEGGKCPQG